MKISVHQRKLLKKFIIGNYEVAVKSILEEMVHIHAS